jgi:two-component system sensor kinase FixL
VRAGLALTKNGDQFPAALTIVRKHGEKGVFTTAIFEDYQTEGETLRQVQELQQEVARLARVIELGEMASTLAHELSQPLSSIAAYSQGCGRLAADSPRRSEELREALLEITQHALWAGSIVQNIREFAGRGTSERTSQEMHELIHRAIRLALMGSRRKDLHTNFQLKAARDVVLADGVQIVQVLTNLLRNALEATECAEQPSIGIRTTVENLSSLVVEVSDNGCGIAAEMEESLFRPFVTGKPHGLGMGLALSKRIVEAHGGRISAHKGRESGSIFSFSIPLVETKTDGERPYDPSRR